MAMALATALNAFGRPIYAAISSCFYDNIIHSLTDDHPNIAIKFSNIRVANLILNAKLIPI